MATSVKLGLDRRAIVRSEANSASSLGGFEKMARRRFQNPKPFKEGNWWWMLVWTDEFSNGEQGRKRKREKLAKADVGIQEIKKIVAEKLRPMNQGLESIGSATNFTTYVEETFYKVTLPLMAKSTQSRYKGVCRNYLIPAFGTLMLRDVSPKTIQAYFSGMAGSKLQHESIDKIRDVLSCILQSAMDYELLNRNACENVRLPAQRFGRRKNKPYITPEQFETLLAEIPEPYASAVYVAIYTGLRVSELAGLRWNDIHESGITIDERYCRGDWGAPKSEASNATIGVNRCVIERIHRMKLLTVTVRAGRAKRKYRVVKKDGPEDLVFQSVKDGKPIRDNNILTRFIKPAARKLGLDFVNWRCLRTSHATWLKLAGADVKDAQAQMRHAHTSTTLDIYMQFVPESQQRAVDKLSGLSKMVQ